ncbi:MAG: hypothetical protein IJV67_02440 [Clostridia bacterium]|nr:hypothetical protein [Clostridia bacterium]
MNNEQKTDFFEDENFDFQYAIAYWMKEAEKLRLELMEERAERNHVEYLLEMEKKQNKRLQRLNRISFIAASVGLILAIINFFV